MATNIAHDRACPRLAVVVPCYNEHESMERAIVELLATIAALADAGRISRDSFILFVDDGSTDETWAAVEHFHRSHQQVKGLKLSRNFGHQAALLAGLMEVRTKCDAAITIDADLQQDPRAIPEFLEAFRKGSEVVLGVRRDRSADAGLKKFSALAFYSLMSVMGVTTVPNHADYRLLGKKALDALALYPEPNMFLRATCLHLGFPVATVLFDVTERRYGKTK